MHKRQIRDFFYMTVENIQGIDPALRDALLATKRSRNAQAKGVDTFVENMTREIQKAHAVKIKKAGRPFKQTHVNELLVEMIALFCWQLETEANRRHESDLAKTVRDREQQEIKDMDNTLDGKPSGIFEEMGVIVNESREKLQ